MRRFFFRSFLFLSPYVLALSIELFLLPIDCFTFRAWEALLVHRWKKVLPGPFYPNMTLTKVEEGDLAHHTSYAIQKRVHWVTDRYGFRKKDTDNPSPSIVIIGDSNIAGSALSQEEMLSEVLEADLGVSVYPYAPKRINSYFKEKRFKDHPPDLVIYARVERELFELSPLRTEKDPGWIPASIRSLRELEPIQTLFVFLDRMAKSNMLHYLRASLKRILSGGPETLKGIDSIYGRIFFLGSSKSMEDISEDTIREIALRIQSYRDAVVRTGSRFLFLPIPDKENIFHELLQRPKATFLARLTVELDRKGVETIPTEAAFEEAYQRRGLLLYHLDDTHWNSNGVRIAAELIKGWIVRNSGSTNEYILVAKTKNGEIRERVKFAAD